MINLVATHPVFETKLKTYTSLADVFINLQKNQHHLYIKTQNRTRIAKRAVNDPPTNTSRVRI